MSSDKTFAQYVLDQIENAGTVSLKAMFGEFAIYCDGVIVVLICDNQVFLKPTVAGRALLETVEEAPPYEGAKPCFLLADEFDDRERFSELVRVTRKELPTPKAKSKATGGRARKAS
jgi:TfoX/Sxy family transcriptional regulator of competence genes